MGLLIDTLAEHLGDAVRTGCELGPIQPERHQVSLQIHGDTHVHDQLIVTTPQATIRDRLPGMPIGWLDDVPAARLAAIHLAYEDAQVPGGLPGFGWLAHSRQRPDALGCLWVSGTFPAHAPAGTHLLRVMVGGARSPTLAARSDRELVEHAQQLLKEVQGITASPLLTHVQRASIPQYPVGFARRLRLLHQVHPRVHFGGWWWGQVGVAASTLFAAERVRAWRDR